MYDGFVTNAPMPKCILCTELSQLHLFHNKCFNHTVPYWGLWHCVKQFDSSCLTQVLPFWLYKLIIPTIPIVRSLMTYHNWIVKLEGLEMRVVHTIYGVYTYWSCMYENFVKFSVWAIVSRHSLTHRWKCPSKTASLLLLHWFQTQSFQQIWRRKVFLYLECLLMSCLR